MKKEDTVKVIKDKRILIGIAALLLIIVIILCVAAVRQNAARQNAGRRSGGMAALMSESLENSGFSYLPGDKRELEKAAEAAAEFLDELVSMGADRQEMVEKLQGYLTSLDWGLTDEQAAELAEWLVDVYLQNYESVYGEPSGVSQTVTKLSDTFLEEMRTDLESISEYLTQLDASVANNKEELIHLTESRDGSYEALTEYLDGLKRIVSTIQSELSRYQNDQSQQQVLSTQEFADMKTRMDSLSAAILELENRLKENIQNADVNNGGRYEALVEDMDGLSSDLQNKVKELDQRLSDMLSELKSNGNRMSASLSELISSSQNELSILLNQLEMANQQRYENSEAQSNSRNEQIDQNINEKVNLLSGRLDEVHANINATQTEIKQILADMDEADDLRLEEIMKSFAEINAELAAINEDMDTAHEELKTLIETVRTEAGENQEELLGVLNEIDASFTEQNSQNYEALVQSLNSQSEAMKAQMEAMSSSLIQNTAQIAVEVSSGNAGILEKLTQMESSTNAMLSGLSSNVQSVFQRVSNGKKLLASALLTKDVIIDEDATFQEIYNGIISIPQQVVIGVDRIPGTIEYEYHHHAGSSESGGGCYTVEDVHHHDVSCYQLCNYSWTGCAGDNGWTDGENISHCPYRETHSICNNGQPMYKTYDHPNYGGSQSGHRNSGSSTHAVLVCSKTEGQHYGWKTGCGLQEGQIVGAHIVYNSNMLSAAAATYEKQAAQSNISFQELEKLLKAYSAKNMPDLTEEGSLETDEKETMAEEEADVKPEKEDNAEEAATKAADDAQEAKETVVGSEEASQTAGPETETDSGTDPEIQSEAETVPGDRLGADTEDETADNEDGEIETGAVDETKVLENETAAGMSVPKTDTENKAAPEKEEKPSEEKASEAVSSEEIPKEIEIVENSFTEMATE